MPVGKSTKISVQAFIASDELLEWAMSTGI
jgi:hypothetical protein